MKLTKILNENVNYLKNIFSSCDDVVFREFLSGYDSRSCMLIFSDGMCDKDLLSDRVLEKIMASAFLYPENQKRPVSDESPKISVNAIDFTVGCNTEELILSVLSGNGVVLIDKEDTFISVSSTKFSSRPITEPESKTVIRGPRDGFTENFLDSTSLLRRRLKTPDFKMEFTAPSSVASSRVAVCYIKSRVNEKRLSNIKEKLKHLNTDIIIDSGQVENFLEGKSHPLFSTIQATERADDAVFALKEGKIVLLVENSPFVLIIPGLILSMLTSSEDYYSSRFKRNAILFLRILSCVATILLPAMYIGFVKFNPDFLPDKIILMLSGSRKNVALPAFTEILFMQLVFEVIMEASIRLPGQIASTVGIVGSIVIGQAVVDANIVNIMVVIIVAINAVLTFVSPSYELSKTLRLLRLIFMVISAFLGLYGTALSFAVLMIHLCSIDSFGAEYLFPFADNENVRKEENVA